MIGILSDQVDVALVRETETLVVLSQRFSLDRVMSVTGAADPLDALIYGLLACRTSPTTARTAYARLRSSCRVWGDLVGAPFGEIEEIIKPTGFAHQRASFIQKLVARVHLDFPDGALVRLRTWDDEAVERYLTSLPGIGTLIAYQVMLDTLDRPVMPVTQPLTRLLSRLGISSNPTRLDRLLRTVAGRLPTEQRRQFHNDLLWHAQDVCRPRFPRCGKCCLTDLCAYYRQNRMDRPRAPRAPDAPTAPRGS